MAPKLSEIELLLNKAALQQARLRQALGIQHEDGDDAEARRKEDELFKCEPELAGLGYKTKDDRAAALKRQAASSENQLRRQMLGKNARSSSQPQVAKSSRQRDANAPESSSDDEGGRAASFKSKRPKLGSDAVSTETVAELAGHDKVEERKGAQQLPSTGPGTTSVRTAHEHPKPAKRVAGSYLDEVLAQKAKQRRKKSEKKEKAKKEREASAVDERGA